MIGGGKGGVGVRGGAGISMTVIDGSGAGGAVTWTLIRRAWLSLARENTTKGGMREGVGRAVSNVLVSVRTIGIGSGRGPSCI